MPTDLDDLFAALGRQADAIAIAPAEQARRRGRRRGRNQAVVAAAVAVCLVAGAVGGLLHRSGHSTAPAVTPSSRTLSEIGRPVGLDGTLTTSTTVASNGRVFTLWQEPNGEFRVLAADLETGAEAWAVQHRGEPDELATLSPVAQAVVLSTDRTATAYDPADGHRLWELPLATSDVLTVHRRALVRWSRDTGELAALDWRSGEQRWSLPGLGDGPVWSLAVHSVDQMRADGGTDDRLVQVTGKGQVRVVNVDTGTVSRSLTVPAPDGSGMMRADNGWLITSETSGTGYRVRATDLRTGDSTVVFTGPPGNALTAVAMYLERLFVLDTGPTGTRVVAIDLRQSRRLWEVLDDHPMDGISAIGGHLLIGGQGITELYDQNGLLVYRTPDSYLHWLTTETLLRLTMSGTVERIRVADGRVEPLGQIPLQLGPCDSTPDRLACPVADGLRIWRLPG
ncbi:PQQ-binding-like beta-propeller repeat protein [Actinoplanes oblitus]|uniref:PQQ-binding-like beta-propeller repeat protein n=1 Tax=Actinoplanes oblitus TaxID=3040509 RepID=A0ABY8WCC2_9ACTN|nr:PQQ-binding-like beta-propeller repeat protein [Actinoplanes oblitus]WIM95455.1 PQQ-binding-like beta-propeller repeat protein [Actinoplanes oblitus]